MKIKIILFVMIFAISCFPGKRKRLRSTPHIKTNSLVNDSLQKRKNDSIALLKFSEAENQWKKSEKKKAFEQKKRVELAAKNDVSNFNYKNTKNAPIIDSLTFRIKELNRSMYSVDSVYKKMATLSFEDQILFLNDEVRLEKINRSDIIQYYTTMYTIYNLEKEKQVLILETQTGNDRGLVSLHIKETLEKIRKLNEQIASLKSK